MEQSSTIRKAMKNANLTAVITAAIVFLLLALLVVFSIKPLYNHFAGPFDVTAEELISYQGPEDTLRTYVTTHPEIALDTNFYYFEEQEGGVEKIIHSYYALLFDENLLLTKYPGAGKGDLLDPEPVTGRIVRLTDSENIEVLQALITEFPNLEDTFLPYMLDTTAKTGAGWLSIAGMAILAIILIWNLVSLIRRSSDASKHPVARDLSLYGDWQQMAREIDTQMAEPHETYGNKYHLTRDWLIYQTKTRFDAVPYRDLIWHNMFEIKNRSFGVVTHTNYSVMVYDRFGKIKNLPYGIKSDAVLDLLKNLQIHAPWAYSGYSAELQKTWNHDRETMISAVDARKQALEPALVEDQEVIGETSTN